MKDNVSFLPLHSRMSVSDISSVINREEFDNVMVIGWGKDDRFICRVSEMKRSEALYMIEHARLHVLGIQT